MPLLECGHDEMIGIFLALIDTASTISLGISGGISLGKGLTPTNSFEQGIYYQKKYVAWRKLTTTIRYEMVDHTHHSDIKSSFN